MTSTQTTMKINGEHLTDRWFDLCNYFRRSGKWINYSSTAIAKAKQICKETHTNRLWFWMSQTIGWEGKGGFYTVNFWLGGELIVNEFICESFHRLSTVQNWTKPFRFTVFQFDGQSLGILISHRLFVTQRQNDNQMSGKMERNISSSKFTIFFWLRFIRSALNWLEERTFHFFRFGIIYYSYVWFFDWI